MSVVCCQAEFSGSGRSLVQRSPTECGVSECNRETSTMRRSWPIKSCCAVKNLALLISIKGIKDVLRHGAHICNKT